MEIITKSAAETKKLGKKIGSSLKGGEILALSGDLGSGKTTFIQGLCEGLKIKSRIISPTFILMREYEVSKDPKKTLYHLDLYRLSENAGQEVKSLGVSEFWGRSDSIVVLEWAEKAIEVIPMSALWIKFFDLGEDKRMIIIEK